MKKLITIALLTLSTFSLVAEFPVRRDNFKEISSDGKWNESNVSCKKYQFSNPIMGEASRLHNTPIVSFCDKKINCDITVFDSEGDSWVAVDKRNAEKEVVFSEGALFKEDRRGKTYVFFFTESDSIDLVVSNLDGAWFMAWRMWE